MSENQEVNAGRERTSDLPIPVVSRAKQFFADASITLAESAQAVDDIQVQLDLDKQSLFSNPTTFTELTRQKSVAIIKFYSDAKGVMRALQPHVALEDQAEFHNNWQKLKDRTNPEMYDVESVDELCTFILQTLKNSNLSELGFKSRLEEIIGEIDIEQM